MPGHENSNLIEKWKGWGCKSEYLNRFERKVGDGCYLQRQILFLFLFFPINLKRHPFGMKI